MLLSTYRKNRIEQNVSVPLDCVCLYMCVLCAPLTLAVPVWLCEAVLVPTGQRCIWLVVVGSVLAVICPQGAL